MAQRSVGSTPGHEGVGTMPEQVVHIDEHRMPIASRVNERKQLLLVILQENNLYPNYCGGRQNHVLEAVLVEFCVVDWEVLEAFEGIKVLGSHELLNLVYACRVVKVLVKALELEGN